MKSFQARMYVEDGMATIEFDIEMMGEADQEFDCNFGFVLYQIALTSEEKVEEWKKLGGPEKLPVFLGVFDVGTMLIAGEMSSKSNFGFGEKVEKKIGEELATIKEETIKFIELYLDGKVCEKHNYIFPPGVNPTVLNDKHILNGKKWKVFAKNRETGEYGKHDDIERFYVDSPQNIAEMKQNLEAVRNDEMPKEHPDGTAGQDWIQTSDEDGNKTVRPKKEED